MQWFCTLLLLAMFHEAAQETAPTEETRRLAFVAGNADYSPLPPLSSASNEADLMAEALRNARFEVTRVKDFSNATFQEFLEKVRPGDTCLFYYSGYTAKAVDFDKTYLLPLNFNPGVEIENQQVLSLRRILDDLGKHTNGIKIIVLEAARTLKGPLGGATAGLLNPDPNESPNTLYAFAASGNQTVDPPPVGQIGRFTKAIVQNIAKSGSRISDAFLNAKALAATEGGPVPYVYDNLATNAFFFHDPEKAPPPKTVVIERDPPPVVVKQEPSIRVPFQNRKDRQQYVWIPHGTFKMGCAPNDNRCKPGERPQHPVALTRGYWLGQTEVTVGAYQRYVQSQKLKMPEKPMYPGGWTVTNRPIVNVSWAEAQAFCEWAGGRLPTEAEWERAARGGAEDEIYPGNNENSREKANFYGKAGLDSYDDVAPVQQFDPNAFGLYDMLGNVWEWVSDWFGPYPSSAVTDPRGPDKGKEHITRGGSYLSDYKEHLRLSYRERSGAKGVQNIGMRCVLDDTPETKALLQR
jgi:formylglycine-generating enzyme required for sulfatase activity